METPVEKSCRKRTSSRVGSVPSRVGSVPPKIGKSLEHYIFSHLFLLDTNALNTYITL